MDSTSLKKLIRLICNNTCLEPDVAIAVCKLVQKLLEESGRMGLGVQIVAQKIVPALSPYAVIPKLTQFQVKEILDTCRECLNFVEETEFYGKRFQNRQSKPPLRCHSIAGQAVPQVLITTPHSPSSEHGSFLSVYESQSNVRRNSATPKFSLTEAMNRNSLVTSDTEMSKDRRKSAADIPAWLLGTLRDGAKVDSTTSLQGLFIKHAQTSSMPGSPSTRRHSDTPGAGKPNTLSNLGHNLACTLWKSVATKQV